MNEKYNYDKASDSLYIWLKEGEEEGFEEIVPGINVELDKDNNIMGIEILHISRLFSKGKRKSETPQLTSLKER